MTIFVGWDLNVERTRESSFFWNRTARAVAAPGIREDSWQRWGTLPRRKTVRKGILKVSVPVDFMSVHALRLVCLMLPFG